MFRTHGLRASEPAGSHLYSREPSLGMSTMPVQNGNVEAVVVSFSPVPGRQLPSSLLPIMRKLSPSCVPSFLTRNVTLTPRRPNGRQWNQMKIKKQKGSSSILEIVKVACRPKTCSHLASSERAIHKLESEELFARDELFARVWEL